MISKFLKFLMTRVIQSNTARKSLKVTIILKLSQTHYFSINTLLDYEKKI